MSLLKALTSGLVGAGVLTLAHQLTQKLTRHAPRMDVLGERAIAETMRTVGVDPPSKKELYPAALAGDLVANSAYYGLVGLARPEAGPVAGAVLGLLAGLAAVALPGPLGLGSRPSARTPQTRYLTVGLYLLGGIAAGLAHRATADDQEEAT